MGVENVHATKLNEEGYSKGVWFVFEAGLLPPQNEINKVICDIINGRNIYLSYDGKMRHAESCRDVEHELDSNLINCVTNIKEQCFRIALWEFDKEAKPLAFCLSHEISHSTLPHHPHINGGGEMRDSIFIPDSMCFIEDIEEVGREYPWKIINSISQIRLWIFRHYVWLATGLAGNPIWIGSDVVSEDWQQFAFKRNSNSRCRCGRNRTYAECHLIYDYTMELQKYRIPMTRAKYTLPSGRFNFELYDAEYAKSNYKKREAYNKLKSLLASIEKKEL